MKATLNLTKSVQAIALCTGLLVGGAVWATCPENAGADKAAASDPPRAGVSSTDGDARGASPMDAELYGYLHDRNQHKLDTLGDYGKE
jgi:hypothetical protein